MAAAALLTLLASSDALAYTPAGEWVDNPYPGYNPFYCDYYGSEYWCYGGTTSQWVPASETWYDQNYAEMQQLGML